MLRVAEGDAKAFRALYERYKVPVLSYIHSLVRHPTVAEELAQEAFLRVYRTRASYTRESRFTTWLWTIARNLAIDYLRKRAETGLPENWETTIPSGDVGELADAETQLLRAAEQESVRRCLQGLPVGQREAMALRTFAEMSYEEIAETVSASVAAVKSMLHRAKLGLMKCLSKKEAP